MSESPVGMCVCADVYRFTCRCHSLFSPFAYVYGIFEGSGGCPLSGIVRKAGATVAFQAVIYHMSQFGHVYGGK